MAMYFPDEASESLGRILQVWASFSLESESECEMLDTFLLYMFEFPRESTIETVLGQINEAVVNIGVRRNQIFVAKALLAGFRRDKLETHNKLFKFLSDATVAKTFFESAPPDLVRKLAGEMPHEARHAAYPFIYKICPDLSLGHLVDDQLATIELLFECRTNEAVLVRHSLRGRFHLESDSEDQELNVIFTDGFSACFSLEHLSHWNDIFTEFTDSDQDELPVPLLLLRLGFRKRAIASLADSLPAVPSLVLKSVLSIEPSLADSEIALLGSNPRPHKTLYQERLVDLIQSVSAVGFIDFRIFCEIEAAFSKKRISPLLLRDFDLPEQHSALNRVWRYCSHFNPNCSPTREDFSQICAALHSGFPFHRTMLSDLEEMITGVFLAPIDEEILEPALEALANALKADWNNDIFLAAFVKEAKLIVPRLASFALAFGPLPFRWSQIFAELIAGDSHFSEIAQSVHPAFAVLVARNFSSHPVLGSLLDLVDDPRLKKLKAISDAELKVAGQLRSGESVGLIDPPDEVSFDHSLHFSSFLHRHVAPPLVDEPGPALHSRIFQEDFFDASLTVVLTLTNGRHLSYVLAPRAAVDPRLTLLCDLITVGMNETPECARRAQRLPVLRSLAVKDGFNLIYAGKGHLLAKRQYLSALLTAEPVPPRESVDLTSSERMVEWFWYFASRYAAISMVQICFNSPIPSPYDIAIDYQHAEIAFTSLEGENIDMALLRTSGQLSPLCSRPVVFGPMRTALVAAAQALTMHREKMSLFVEATVKRDHSAFLANAVRFSARDGNPLEVEREVRSLINISIANQGNVFAIPWI
jgi:hypothetical protein